MNNKDVLVIITCIVMLLMLLTMLIAPNKNHSVMHQFCQGRIQRTNFDWGNKTMYLCNGKNFVCNTTECYYIISSHNIQNDEQNNTN